MNQQDLRHFRDSVRKFERNFSSLLKEHCCSPGLSLPQCHVLLEIEISGEATGADLSRSLCLDPSTLSRNITGLVAIGLVQRSPHPKNGRLFRHSLTDQGKRTCDRMNKDYDAYFRKIFSSIPKSEHDGVIRSFEVFVSTLVEEDFPSPKHGV
jgi:DNA-binding MarR family transcriptional regulator